MCYGHPHHHPCGHQSVKWHYCPRAKIDVTTGHATVCDKTTYAISQPSKSRCPLKHCHYKELGGVWDCCECKQGPNTQGWCAFANPSWKKNFQTDENEWVETCDHGCCRNCTRSESAGPLPEDESNKKKKKARKVSTTASSSSPSSAPSKDAGVYADAYGEYAYDGERPGTSSGRHHHGHGASSHGKGKGKDKR